MGVLGLWQLLAPVGQPVTLESLENKIFAVDISIWLNQAVKGYRDSQGGSVPNAHLLSLYSRLCKLLFYKIRPIIVFDGGYPELKKETIINRQKRRAAVKQNSRDVGLKILTNYLASQQLGQAVPSATQSKSAYKPKEKPRDEIFKLPPLPESSQSVLSEVYESSEGNERKFINFSHEDIKYLNQIDIESEDFNELPPDVKREILATLKESRKHRTWDQYEELPKESNDFSNFQMQNLLKRRKLQSKLEQVQKDLRQINSSAYVSQYTNDHVIGETNKIMSDDVSYYVLLKKIIEQKEGYSDKFEDGTPGTSVMADTKNAFIRDIENIDVDEDYFSSDTNPVVIEKETNLLPIKIKVEKSTSDEDSDVDNPPLIDSSEHKHHRNLEENLNNEDISNTDETQDSVIVQETCQSVEQSSVYATKIIAACEKSITDIEYHNSGTDQEAKLSNAKAKEFKTNEEINKCTSKSNIDEVRPYEDSNVLTRNSESSSSNANFKESSSYQAIELETESLVLPESNSYEESEKESCIKIQNTEKNCIHAGISENSLSEQESLDVPYQLPHEQSPESQIVVDDNLHKANTELQDNLDAAAAILEAEQAKKDRQSNTVQDHMVEECKELLQLFGIPYVVSPLEAEAQCAFFDIVEFTQGTITDDSDVWLFGGKRVFKNFFTQQKFVEQYKDTEIFNHFGLSRKKLINFALLTGSDYTVGIEGVGPVTAMEIISEFPGEGIEALEKFKEWWKESNRHARPPENKIRAKLLKLVLTNNFPDEKVFEAYLNPEIDSSLEKFTWGRPDLAALRDYAKERFGWNQSKVDCSLLPVLKKLNDRDKQMHLDSFFTLTLKKQTDLFPSKRIMTAVKKITSSDKLETGNNREPDTHKRKSEALECNVISKKVIRKSSSVRGRGRGKGRGRKSNAKSQGPSLSESSSDSDS